MSIRTLIAAEFFKMRKRMMTWVVAALLVGLIILLYTVLWSVSARVETFADEQQIYTGADLRRALFIQTSVPFSLQIIGTFGTLLAVVLAAGAAGSEYSWGTVRLMATASSGRIKTIVARLFVVSALIATGALLAVAIGLAYSAIITQVSGGTDYDFIDAEFIRHQFYSYLRTLFVMAPYVTLAFAAAVVGRSTLAGVGAGVGFAFLEPVISGLMRLGGEPWRSIPNFLLNSNATVILLRNNVPDVARFGPRDQELQAQDRNSIEEATVVLFVYIVVFLAVTLWTYRRRDITAGG
jgi:ABC-type transport system involved in multi-copper enzyme maturation permease subunit